MKDTNQDQLSEETHRVGSGVPRTLSSAPSVRCRSVPLPQHIRTLAYRKLHGPHRGDGLGCHYVSHESVAT